MSNGYNGWANYETWRANLEIFDGYSAEFLPEFLLEGYDMEEEKEKAVRDLANALEEYADEAIQMEIPEMRGLAYDLAMDFLNRVDFEEIAEHMVDDYMAEAN